MKLDGEPRIIGFICNWGAYGAADRAGAAKTSYPANIRLVRLACLGRVSLGLVLKAFEKGANGVMLLGCPPQDCHHDSGMEKCREVFTQARKTLHLLGIDPKRLELAEIAPGADDVFIETVSKFARYISAALAGC